MNNVVSALTDKPNDAGKTIYHNQNLFDDLKPLP